MLFSAIQKKGLILSTAISLINECGMQVFSTREIARRLGISEGTIFNYFPRKNDLILAALDQFSQYDEDLFQTVKIKNIDPREAIKYYVNSYSIFYENYPEIVALYQAFYVANLDKTINQKVKDIYLRREKFMKKMIEEAQLSLKIKKELDSDMLGNIITSSIRGIYNQWRIENYKFNLCERTMEVLNILLDSFQ
jgi:AcrR family transcriptional regulator